MTPLRIVSVCSCVGERGLGVNEGLERAVEFERIDAMAPALPPRHVAAWFRSKFNDHITDADAVEFRFPAGRVNRGGLIRPQTAKWQSLLGPIWDGLIAFLMDLDSTDIARVQIALPFPTKKRHIAEIMDRLTPRIALRFEDLGSLAPQFMKRIQPLLDAGYRVGADTVPTDRISEPGKATRFDLPRGYERVTWGVRARVVRKWLRVAGAPISRAVAMQVYDGLPADWPRLSLLLTGDPDDVMPVADLERIRPLLHEIRVQNVKDAGMVEWIKNQRSNT